MHNITNFCDTFILNTYSDKVPVCDESIQCHKSSFTSMMVKCTVHNILLRSSHILDAEFSQKFYLLSTERNTSDLCPQPTLQSLSAAMESVDYMYISLAHMAGNSPVQMDNCFHLKKKVAFFFMEDFTHIYFGFLGYYSLYKSIEDSGLQKGEYTIVTIPKYPKKAVNTFKSFEEILFPDVHRISHYSTPTCIDRAIFVPYAYYTVPFRCKRDAHLVPYCTECTGEKYSKPYASFRSKVLEACGLSDSVISEERRLRTMKRFVLVSRTPLDRKRPTERIVVNEKELVKAIGREFPSVNLTVVHMEKLGVCQQVELAHKTDVLMGPHGAGLVHLWWMQDDAVTLEFEPDYKRNNPTFRVLSALTGRRYERVKLYEAPGTPLTDQTHINYVVNVDEVIAKLRTL